MKDKMSYGAAPSIKGSKSKSSVRGSGKSVKSKGLVKSPVLANSKSL